MNNRTAARIHKLAQVSSSIYRIAYTSMLLYCLFNSRGRGLPPPPDAPRTYH